MTEAAGTRQGYDRWHEEIRERPDEELRSSTWYSACRAALPAPRPGLTLEIACGAGAFARERAGAGERVVAADFSLTAVRESRRRARTGARHPLHLVADAQRLPFRAGVFETFISCETIEHVARPGALIDEASRVIKPGGVLHLSFPSYLNLMGLYRVYLFLRGRRFDSGAGEQPFENTLLWPLVERALRRRGFSVLERGGAVHLVPRPGHPIAWLKALDRKPWSVFLWPFGLHVHLLARRVAPRP